MNQCIFCRSAGPFTTEEHVVPESLGNTELVLRGCVCDECQKYFGTKVERFVLDKTFFGVARVFGGVPTKKGHAPEVDTRLPKGGAIASASSRHSELRLGLEKNGMVRADALGSTDPEFQNGILKLRWEFTPLVVFRLTQFSLKVALEYIASMGVEGALHPDFDAAREFARRGSATKTWPLFFRTLCSKPSEAERMISLATEPAPPGFLWFIFDCIGFSLRINLLNSSECEPPPGYMRISRKPNDNLKATGASGATQLDQS